MRSFLYYNASRGSLVTFRRPQAAIFSASALTLYRARRVSLRFMAKNSNIWNYSIV
jgi:hypothetical protein